MKCTTCQTPLPLSTRECPQCHSKAITALPEGQSRAGKGQDAIKTKKLLIADNLRNAQIDGGIFEDDELISGRYKIIEILGSGTYGIVYKSFDLKLKRLTAIKLLKPSDELDDSESLLQLFYKEVKNAQALTHRNLCRVYDIAEDKGRHFFSMAYAEGQDLRKYLQKKGRLDTSELIGIASQLCEGIGELHKEGYLHRDLKPENIIRNYDGKILITDFGLVELASQCSGGFLVGTLPYMAPEIFNRKKTTPKADIYSLGVILYELSTGRLPFSGDTDAELKDQIKRGPVPPRIMCDEIEPSIENIILSCLSYEPESRPASAKTVESQLAVAIRESPYTANPFICDRAVRGVHFLGSERDHNIKLVMGRIARKQSTFIVGDLRMGKTSFLLRLTDRIESEMPNVLVRYYSLRAAPASYTASTFWANALETFDGKILDKRLLAARKAAARHNYTQTRIENLFARISEKGYSIVLVLDEFEHLLQHENFPASFFAMLRSLIMNTKALIIVPSSRFPMKEIERKSPDLKGQVSSNYFNYFKEVDLSPLDEDAVDDLLSLSGPHFTTHDKMFVRTLAGRQPYLLQTLAEDLFNATGANRWHKATRVFTDKTRHYFDDLWMDWSDSCRSISFYLLLKEWSYRIESTLTTDKPSETLLKNRARIGLKELERAGMIGIINDTQDCHMKHRFNMDGELWGLGPEIFLWWFRDLALLKQRRFEPFTHWLLRKQSQKIDQMDILQSSHFDKLKDISKDIATDDPSSNIESYIGFFLRVSTE